MSERDYYTILGVPRTATAAEIKKAFRALAREHHPDVKPGDPAAEARFKEANEAYEVLGDPEARARYDAFGASPGAGSPFGAGGSPFGGGGWSNFHTEDLGGFADLFSAFFGATATRGPIPVETRVEISLEEAFAGAKRRIELGERKVEVRLPAGVDSGTQVRYRGLGGETPDGPRDLYVNVLVRRSTTYRRDGTDLYREIEVPLRTALLGGEVRVPTLDGAVMLDIPAGTSGGKVFRLRGKGMPKLRGTSRGTLHVTIRVPIPAVSGRRARKAAEAFLDEVERERD